ncbi:hypothetical protein [Streptomyces gilvosporeus]|uniref:hypothetical protein n=1 Tax=Streptomyces gilvosporeus TaxID=553510 RepID=UPI00131CCB84|nr:hypothetical protein [Streptomyces gilvosporeus]
MTESGQGPDPHNAAAGPAREGIVLPANGEPYVPDQQAAPPAGQPWGQPWGPGQQAGPPPGQQPGYGQGQGYGAQPPQAQGQLPPQTQSQLPPQGEGFPPPPQGQPPVPPVPPQQPQQPQQPYGQQAPYGQQPQTPQSPQQPVSQPQPEPQPYDPQQQVPRPEPYRQQPPQPQPERAGELVRATPQTGAPLPPTTGDAATALIRQIPDGSGAALPPEGGGRPETPGESTTMLRVIKPSQGPGQGGPAQPMPQPQSQPMPGAAPAGDSEATQLISPVGAGTPAPPPGAPYGAPPGAPGDRSTPAEFEGLFRDGPGAPGAVGAPDATAQLPRFQDQGQPPYGQQAFGQQGFGQQGYDQPYDQQPYDDEGGRRRVPTAVIVGVVVVVLAGAGLGLGWMLSGGGDDSAKTKGADTSSSPSAKGKTQPSAAADPAEPQAKGLDALLGDSGDSRTSVVNAVRSIGSCDNLGGAAKDLRSAAGQRADLVTRLKQLPVDKIPQHDQLTAALTKAWQSSAAADNHFAAWAGQVHSKKGCHKGKARNTGQYGKGVAASGEATKAKQQAAAIWNPIAKKYGLTQRPPITL